MKKGIFLLVLSFCMLVGITNVKAISLQVIPECSFNNDRASETATETCQIKIKVDGEVNNKSVIIPIQLTNLILTGHQDAEGWKVEEQGNGRLALTPTNSTISAGEHLVTTLSLSKVDYEAICNLTYANPYFASIPSTPTVKHSCEQADGSYYDKNGNIVDEADYRRDCLSCQKQPDGTFTGKDGQVVSEDVYISECTTPKSCSRSSNGTYTGKNGNPVTEEQYRIECEKHSCDHIGDKYYDKNGKEITAEQYTTLCPNGSNPNTGANLPLLTLFGLLGVGIILLNVANKTKKFN